MIIEKPEVPQKPQPVHVSNVGVGQVFTGILSGHLLEHQQIRDGAFLKLEGHLVELSSNRLVGAGILCGIMVEDYKSWDAKVVLIREHR